MIIVRQQVSPHEVMLVLIGLLAGLALLILRSRLGSTLATMVPAPVTIVLGAGMAAGGAVSLTGLALRTILGLLVERAGMVVLALLFLVYAGFVVEYAGLRGLITVLFFAGFAAANLWRVRQIQRDIAETEKMIRATSPRPEG